MSETSRTGPLALISFQPLLGEYHRQSGIGRDEDKRRHSDREFASRMKNARRLTAALTHSMYLHRSFNVVL